MLSFFRFYILDMQLVRSAYQPPDTIAVLFSQNKPATSNQPAVLFSQNKPAPVISHQPTEQAYGSKKIRPKCPVDGFLVDLSYK
jgi:hypothetical protein